VWGDSERTFAIWKLRGEAKIDKNDVTIGPEKSILRFKVSIDDTSRVEAFYTFDDLRSVESGTISAEASPP
jgi:hypothetical protein